MNRGHVRPARHPACAIVLAASLLAAACQQPEIGPATAAQTAGAPAFEITGASVGASKQLVVSFTASASGVPMTRDEVVALRPTFTVAALSPHPVDGIPAWRNLLTIGTTSATVPPSGPATPPGGNVVTKLPSTEYNGALSGEAGSFTYVFANALPASYVATETLRVAGWLALVAEGTARTNSTYDFVPADAAATPATHDTTLDANCNRCHGIVRAHGRRVGVKVCITCHTWQLVDLESVDPAALDGATAATYPNPVEFARFVHRLHRGKNLPTLYVQSAGSEAISTRPPYAAPPPLPFLPGRNAPEVGRKYVIAGSRGNEYVFGRVVTRQDNFQAPRTVAEGVTFPNQLRDCSVCHAGAPEAYETLYGISARTCSGCHPEVWYGSTPSPLTDAYHLAHTGGPQADDARGPRFAPCWGCHVGPTGSPPSTVWVRISDAHRALRDSPYYDRPSVEVVSVSNLKAGQAPTVVFRLRDRVLKSDGKPAWISSPSAPSPAYEKDAAAPGPAPSPIPRKFDVYVADVTSPGLRIILNGPTSPDYGTAMIQSSDVDADKVLLNPDLPATAGDPATGNISYTFTQKLPADAAGTWVVAFEGRRRATIPFYDVPTQTFRWPFTGEAVTESPDNVLVYVDTATGSWTPAAPGAAAPRRKIVDEARCLACHGRFELHGGQRHQVDHCLDCHAPAKTDWAARPKLSTGNVAMASTFDGIEERSIHLKVLVHRIHTGGATGAATLEGIEPHVVYGKNSTPYFFEEGIFPAGLQDCTRCHVGTTYRVDAVPADAPRTIANEAASLRHTGTSTHAATETGTPPIQAACLGCHASSTTKDHATRKTEAGVETCAQCHVTGSLAVDVAHGLASPSASLVSASFGSIVENILVPRCASAACHGGNPPAAFPRLDAEAAYDAIVNVDSQQASGVKLVKPYEPAASYLLLRMRGEGASVGGIGAPMPIGDAMLDASELAAFEAWILNGAPND